MNTEVHEAGSDRCEPGSHCHAHQRDESGSGYISCFECGHLYRTAGELRRRYRCIVWHMWWGATSRVWLPNPWQPDFFTILRQMATVRADKISFCQWCIHDF